MEQIYLKFCQYFEDGRMEEWTPASTLNHWCIDADARYFTSVTHAGSAEVIPFSPKVDPDGRLDGLAGSDFVHIADNEVMYLQRLIDPTIGKAQYVEVNHLCNISLTLHEDTKAYLLVKSR